MKKKSVLKNIIEKLKKNSDEQHVLIGFDGFIDEIIEVVATRKNAEKYEKIKTITEFSEKIAAMAGLSGNIELVSKETRFGGNGPIMANALLNQGFSVDYIGALGKEKINPLFDEFVSKCEKVISLSEPGHTDALEFNDGKVMLGRINQLYEVNWQNLQKHISEKELAKLVKKYALIAITNWSSLPELSSVMRGFLKIFETQPFDGNVFFDLADPKKRTGKDISEALSIIGNFGNTAILGMNKNESDVICRVLKISENDIPQRAKLIREKLEIKAVTIHPLDGAAVSTEKGTWWFDGPYTKNPKLTTGAGDNYNAGFCSGWLSGFSPEECLALGVYTSGFYVRECHSPTREELIDFMNM